MNLVNPGGAGIIPLTIAVSNTFSIRPRSLLAVSVLSFQMGFKRSCISLTVISLTAMEPIEGRA